MLSLPLLVAAAAWLRAEPQQTRVPGDRVMRTPAGSMLDTAKACQAMFDAKSDKTWRAADGNVSVTLPDGKVAWLFGDTHREGAPFVHNSILVQEGHRLTSTTGGQAIPNDSNGDYFWPTDGLVDGGLLRVFVARVARVSGVGGTFEHRGVALVTFTFDSRGYPMYARRSDLTRSGENDGIQWGTAAVRDGGYVYVFGQRRRQGHWIFGRAVYLARVPAGLVGNMSTWQFWSGIGWGPDQSWAAPIERAESGRFASSFSMDKAGDEWIAVSKHADIAGDHIIEMRADSPIGPFRTTHRFRTPGGPGRWTYQAKGHSELPLVSGRTLVTWNVGAAHPKRMGRNFNKPRCGEH